MEILSAEFRQAMLDQLDKWFKSNPGHMLMREHLKNIVLSIVPYPYKNDPFVNMAIQWMQNHIEGNSKGDNSKYLVYERLKNHMAREYLYRLREDIKDKLPAMVTTNFNDGKRTWILSNLTYEHVLALKEAIYAIRLGTSFEAANELLFVVEDKPKG